MIKKYLVFFSALLALCLLAGCGGSAKVKNDVPAEDIAAAVSAALGSGDFVAVADYYYAGSMKMDVSGFDSYTAMINSRGVNVDEFGIFKAKDKDGVSAVKEAVEAYLQMRKDTWIPEYMPEERPKLDGAEVKVLGDIQTHRFKPHSFDLVTCYNVIEHLEDVQSALLRFCECLRPGGLILIGAPNPRSLSGVVTKFTPHWFHVAFYRYVLGDKKAGVPGQAPFPTHFHPLVTLPRLLDFAREHGLEPQYVHRYESPRFPEMRIRWPWLAGAIDGVAAILNALLMHRIDVRHGDYHVILRKT